MTKQEIYDYLREINCCKVCCLRYFNGRADDYVDVEKSFASVSIFTLDISSSTFSKPAFSIPFQRDIKTAEVCITDQDDDKAEPDAKRPKSNVCIACLDIFSAATRTEVLEKCTALPALAEYDIPTVLSSFSLPVSLSLRSLAIWIALLRRFPDHFSTSEPPDVPLKEVIKLLLNPLLCAQLGKPFESAQNGLMVNVFYEHADSAAEVRALLDVNPQLFKNRAQAPRKFNHEFLTRTAFDRNFTPERIDAAVFARHVPVPARTPATAIRLERITLLGPTVFVAGRYRKLSRALSQSPWVLRGERIMADSVSELICAAVAPHFRVPATAAVFSSSGREDVDVRCLGNGRPFALEIADARRLVLPVAEAARMERAVDASLVVSVRHLQVVAREEMRHIKQGEEDKRKCYRALCVLREPATVEVLQRLNTSDGFDVEQWTPLRVLHRRTLMRRPRRVFEIRARVHKLDRRQLVLDIVTQAGTYVKELVHGEFGRTEPSLRSRIGQWIDIVALDVVAIQLDWPDEVDNQREGTTEKNGNGVLLENAVEAEKTDD